MTLNKETSLVKRVKALEEEIATLKGATHEHTISAETILHIANIVKADIASSLLPPQKATEEVQE